MGSVRVHAERIRRRWALVLLITLAAAAAAVAGGLLQPATWTGRAALAIVSQNRAPEQDAVLGRGYVDLFNQPSLQQELARRTGLGPDVHFTARLAADSPILYVEATAGDPGVAAGAATALATTFRDDVRNNLTGNRVQTARDLTAQLQAAQAKRDALPVDSPERRSVEETIGSLQSQLSTVQSNTSNQLTDLQLDAGVTQDTTGTGRSVALAALGGLALGLVLALALGRTERRLCSAAEVRDRLGRDVVATLDPDAAEADVSGRSLRPLADMLALPDLPVPGTIAVTVPGPEDGPPVPVTARAAVAASLARLRTQQHGSVLLLRTGPGPDTRPGVAEFAGRPDVADLAGLVVVEGTVRVVPPGTGPDGIMRWSRDRAAELLAQSRELAELVLVDAEPVPASAGGLLLCAAADRTLLVVEQGRTRTADAAEAIERIERAGGSVFGIVLCRPSGRSRDRAAADPSGSVTGPAPVVPPRPARHSPDDLRPRPRPAPAHPR